MVGCWCTYPNCHFHFARRFDHPCTRTYARLLGPCFKTGRKEPFGRYTGRSPYEIISRVLSEAFDHPKASCRASAGVLGRTSPTTSMVRDTEQSQDHNIRQVARQCVHSLPRNLTTIAGSFRFPFSNFRHVSLSFQSHFHLSLMVLVHYRSPTRI